MPQQAIVPPPAAGKTKVAILGGGPGGISTAFWLTATPALQAKYDVTIYTPGWRLGGKCASGRNSDIYERIEEHGLHILMGCYENAFRTIRCCYDEWQPRADGPFQQWTDAFTAQRQVTLEEQDSDDNPPAWAPWNFSFPQWPGEPGDSAVPPAPAAVQPASMLHSMTLSNLVDRLATLLQDHLAKNVPPSILDDVDYGTACAQLRRAAIADPTGEISSDAQHRLEQVASRIHRGLSLPLLHLTGESLLQDLRRALILADLGTAIGIGLARDVLPFGNQGYDRLNGQDFRAWLATCGASETALASAPIRALYDLAFAYEGGDSSTIDNGSIAAGVTLRFVLEAVLGYKDAPLWRMNAGMGDTVFTPFYQVLQARGVSIKLFHRVTQIALTADNSAVGTVTLDRQADFIGPGYDPFVTVNGLDCWPDQPIWSQLENGAALEAQGVDFESSQDTTVERTRTLQQGTDFDVVVLAFPPEVIKTVAPQLSQQDPAWKAMLDNSASVATEAFQLWLRPTLAQLGWNLGPTVLSAFEEPFDSWADMSHLLPREGWNIANPPQSIEYFCGCVSIPAGTKADPSKDANIWLTGSIATLWPAAASPGGPINAGLLVSSYYRANVDGSERYVQTPPGSVQHRLPSGQAFFGNLFVAGDWTLTRFSGGCFESAIGSGMLAAAAICGEPTLIEGESGV